MVEANNPPAAGTTVRHPKAVVWDLDGTLIDSLRDIASALNTLLAEQGLGPLSLADIRSMVGDGSAKLIERGLAACGHPISEAESAALMTRFLPIYAEHATATTRLYPGAADALRDFASAGVRQGICTNKPEAISRRVLADLGVAEYFELVIGGDSLAQKKPDPRPLRHVLAGLGATTPEGLMIGDSAVDVATARAAGVRVALVINGYCSVSATSLHADFLVNDLASLPAALAKHGARIGRRSQTPESPG